MSALTVAEYFNLGIRSENQAAENRFLVDCLDDGFLTVTQNARRGNITKDVLNVNTHRF